MSIVVNVGKLLIFMQMILLIMMKRVLIGYAKIVIKKISKEIVSILDEMKG